MSDLSPIPPFETIYLEIQPRPDGSAPRTQDVLALFSERALVGVAQSGDKFGVKTPVIAKLAMTMVNDSALVYSATAAGDLTPGEFTADVCEWLARSLDTEVIADEYVLYAPGMRDGTVDFVELDPRRQSIEQPAGFPNEWRLSPTHLTTQAITYVDGTDGFTASAIARDTQQTIESVRISAGQAIMMPQGIVELPITPASDPSQRVVLFAQGGEAKYVHLVMGKAKKQLRMTIANLPRFESAVEAPKDSPADRLSELISNAGLVAGSVDIDHPNFPTHILPLYQELTDHTNTHAFFSRVAEALHLEPEISALADNGFILPAGARQHHTPDQNPLKKRRWFRR